MKFQPLDDEQRARLIWVDKFIRYWGEWAYLPSVEDYILTGNDEYFYELDNVVTYLLH